MEFDKCKACGADIYMRKGVWKHLYSFKDNEHRAMY